MKPLAGLRFLLEGGIFVTVLVTEEEGKTIIQKWISGEYNLRSVDKLGSVTPPMMGWSWAVKVDSIRAVHMLSSVELEQVLSQLRPHSSTGRGLGSYYKSSGL